MNRRRIRAPLERDSLVIAGSILVAEAERVACMERLMFRFRRADNDIPDIADIETVLDLAHRRCAVSRRCG